MRARVPHSLRANMKSAALEASRDARPRDKDYRGSSEAFVSASESPLNFGFRFHAAWPGWKLGGCNFLRRPGPRSNSVELSTALRPQKFRARRPINTARYKYAAQMCVCVCAAYVESGILLNPAPRYQEYRSFIRGRLLAPVLEKRVSEFRSMTSCTSSRMATRFFNHFLHRSTVFSTLCIIV